MSVRKKCKYNLSGVGSELHISLIPIIVILFVLSEVAKYLVAVLPGWSRNWSEMWMVLLFFQALLVAAWFLERRKRFFGRWLTILALIAVVELSSRWLGMTGPLMLMPLPVALAAALISIPAAGLTAAMESVLLLSPLHTGTGLNTIDVGVTLTAIWALLGVVYTIYRPLHNTTRWSWEHYQRSERLLEDARDRQLKLNQALDDLANANRQLTLINEKVASLRLIAEEARRTKATFVARVSHEFRTPLNMIIGLTDLLIETPEIYGERLPPKLMDHLGIVQRNCEHLSSMIDDVLDLSQIEVGRVALRREWVKLEEIIDRALTVVSPLAEKKKLSLEVQLPENLPLIYCDRIRIMQVIVNLMSNAARYTDSGGIKSQVVHADGYVTVSVTDTGPGIAPDDAQSIFEPFSQTRSGLQRKDGGSGLGLSISKQFVKLHGGQMWLETELGVGSVFSFKLPISGPVEPLSTPERWIAEGWEKRPSSPSQPPAHLDQRVIICDETGDLHDLFTRYSDEVEYVRAANLDAAVRELRRCPAQAVLLNAASPDALWSLTDQAKQQIRNTPLIGTCMPPKTEKALAAGATTYLIKPVKRAKLLAAIQSTPEPVRRILLVDDEEDALRMLELSLRAYDEALEVVTAFNGQEALDILRDWHPDLMLLDVVMPEMDGWQVLTAKNEDDRIALIPVILMSGQDPRESPTLSPVLTCTMGEGLSFSKLLTCSRQLAGLLLAPD